jgi:hypothetical protein
MVRLGFYVHVMPRVALGGIGLDGDSGQGSLPLECGCREPQCTVVREASIAETSSGTQGKRKLSTWGEYCGPATRQHQHCLAPV